MHARRTIFVERHAPVPDLEHVEVVPPPRSSLLSHRRGKVDDLRDRAVCARARLARDCQEGGRAHGSRAACSRGCPCRDTGRRRGRSSVGGHCQRGRTGAPGGRGTHVHDVARDAPAVRDRLCRQFQKPHRARGVRAQVLTSAKFHGPSSPQLHMEYKIGRPVAFRACDMFA